MQFNLNAFAELPLAEKLARVASLFDLGDDDAELLLNDWHFLARPDQLEPPPPWQTWLFLAGRGAGKTRAGVEWVRGKVKAGHRRICLIAPTTADVRDVMIEGSSGILANAWEHDRDDNGELVGIPLYEPSKRHRLTWQNGAMAHGFTAEEPDRLRGPQHDALWCDELAAWQYAEEAWNMAMFGLRIGPNPQAMISTTPKPIPLLRELLRSKMTRVTTATTYANRANLAASFFDRVIVKYEGTRLGRQELRGELIEEMEGALWNRAMIEDARAPAGLSPSFARVVVGVDPAVSANDTSALTGIVVAAIGHDGRGYVLEDLSGRYSPDKWARIAVDALDTHGADRIVAEGNQGGNMVRHTLATVRANLPIAIVHATRSKQARAEPIAALYEQKRVTHMRPMEELEDQLCTWEPLSGDPSPDRLDAMVWAMTALMLRPKDPKFVMPYATGTPRYIPGQKPTLFG